MTEPVQSPKEAAIMLEHVTKSFAGREILHDVNLQIAAGEAFCLVGRSGAGKSVTLKLISGLVPPDKGRIAVRGAEICHGDTKALVQIRKQIGFLFQNAALFDSISVAENVAFPLRRHTRKSEEEIREIVHEKLGEVELEKEGDKMPAQLSGGMRKRAGLARALALDPGILLIDEPSSGLDRITAGEMYDLLLQMKQKRKVTMVVVTHDVVGVREFVDRFAVLNDARILASGTAEELARSHDDLVQRLLLGAQT